MGKGEEFVLNGVDGVVLEERGSGGGDHHGVDDDWKVRVAGKQSGDGADVARGEEHAGFDGGDGKGLEEEFHLIRDDFGWNGVDGADDIGGF